MTRRQLAKGTPEGGASGPSAEAEGSSLRRGRVSGRQSPGAQPVLRPLTTRVLTP